MKRILYILLLICSLAFGQDVNVDRYEVDVSSNGQTLTITDIGNVSNAFVKLVGNSIKGSGGVVGSTANLLPNGLGCGVLLTATNELTFYRETTSTVKMMVEVWSYTGSPGGEYEFINRQQGSLLLNNGSSSVNTSITGLSDRNKVIPIYSGWTSNENSTADYETVTLACHVNATSEIVFERGGNGNGGTVTPYYQAVEFTGSAWSVGHAVSTSHDIIGTTGTSLNLNTDSTGSGGSTFDVGDWSTAMILETTMGGDSAGETGLADCQLVSDPGATTTTVDIRLGDNNARNDAMAYVHVLQTDNLIVDRYENNNQTEGNNTYNTLTVTGPNSATPLNRLSLEWTLSTTGTGTAWARGCLVAQLTAFNIVQHWVHRSGNNVMVRAGVVDMSGLVASVGGLTGQIKIWDGSWTPKPVKVWDGSWSTMPVKTWNGSSWVITPY